MSFENSLYRFLPQNENFYAQFTNKGLHPGYPAKLEYDGITLAI